MDLNSLSDDDLVKLAAQKGINSDGSRATPFDKIPDKDLIEMARQKGIGPDGSPLPTISMKNPKDVKWGGALLEGLLAPLTGKTAGRKIPDSANAATASMGLIGLAGGAGSGPVVGRALPEAAEAANIVKPASLAEALATPAENLPTAGVPAEAGNSISEFNKIPGLLKASGPAVKSALKRIGSGLLFGAGAARGGGFHH